MASPTFQKRFKDKVGVVLRTGEFSTSTLPSDGSSPISKATAETKKILARPKGISHEYTHSHSSLNSKPCVLGKGPTALPAIHERYNPPRQSSLGALNHRSNSSALPTLPVHKSSASIAETVTKSLEFHPYTMEDYREVRKRVLGKLGGLGPVMVGREEWIRAKEMRAVVSSMSLL